MKNILKSIFISTFPALAIYEMVISCINLIQQGFSFRYLGLLIISSTIVFFFAGLFLKPQARTSKKLNKYTAIIGIGFLINVVLGSYFEENNLRLSSVNLLLLLCWNAYILWYSEFENRKSVSLNIGKQLPTFKVEDISNNIISS